jgi:threonine dehydrogenase-like Zn-dependent dehydrogenase
MRQLTYLEPGRIEWHDVDRPSIGSPVEAVVEPLAVATCDLDRAIVDGQTPFEGPFALGHEMIGRVVDVGDGVTVARPGDRVAVPFQVSCGECDHCLRGQSAACKRGGMYGIGSAGGGFGGALSDAVLVPFADAMLVPLPPEIEPVAAASAPDNIGDAWRAVVPPLRDRPGGRILVLAGPGPNSIALYAVQVARASDAGAVEVLTRNEAVARRAAELGAEVAHVDEWPDSHGRFDVVVENANESRGLACALGSLRVGGHCTVTSMHFSGEAKVPILDMWLRGVTISVGRCNSRQTLEPVLDLIASGAIDPGEVTSEVAARDEAPEALLGYTTKLVVTFA